MLTYLTKCFSCSKGGNAPCENEDAYSLPDADSSLQKIRIGIADGATESSFSKEWAALLVDHYKMIPDFNTNFLNIVFPEIRKAWLDRINYASLEWWAQQKMEMGAFASFLGIDIDLSTGITNMVAVGDSNSFVFRDEKMMAAFPILHSEIFSNTPFLISSEPLKNATNTPLFLQSNFTLLAGDILVVGTDAISQWILKEVELGNYQIDQLIDLLGTKNSPSSFQIWLDEKRKTHEIKNDDTTIIIIQFA